MRWIFVLMLLCVSLAEARERGGSVRVRSHLRSDGAAVQSHYRSGSDSSFSNNWSTRGNSNPWTGSPGRKVYPTSRR